jgi:hypothetical protein
MRPTSFDPSALRRHLRRHKIADFPQLKRVLGTDTDLTVFRKLKQLQYLASYTHRGRFYTLAEIAGFDDRGLWSHEGVWFSRRGTLLATLEALVIQSPNGYYAHELADALHAEVQQPLRHLVERQRLARMEVDGQFLYTAIESVPRRQQLLARRSAQAVPVAVHSADLQASPHELKALSFCSMACSMNNSADCLPGWSPSAWATAGDTLLADFLGLDVHTVARGRQQLLDQNVVSGRSRRTGGGRTPAAKKRPT